MHATSIQNAYHGYAERMKSREAYRQIAGHYGERTAERSKVPLINHINEGLEILARIEASGPAMEAFCLHPLLQADADLGHFFPSIMRHTQIQARMITPVSIALAMEYRNIANAWLSDKVSEAEYTRGNYEIVAYGKPKLSPLKDVNDMLIADKVQNRKDFVIHHKGTHPRSDELDLYFKMWLEALDISEERYEELIAGL